jgi:hypothetical protein
MSQRRLNIFGDLIDTADLPEMIANLMSPGRLIGNDFVVAASDLVQISPGSCLLPDGVLVIEDEIKSLVVPSSSLATDYTVIYQLEDTRTLGGSPAILRLLSGIKRQVDFTDGTILGWIRYPGGSIPLSSAFFIQPSSLRVTSHPDTFYYSNHCPLTAIRPAMTMSIASSDVNATTNTFTALMPFPDEWAVTILSNGTLPSPLVAGTTYYVVNPTSTSFQLSATPAGLPIDLTTSGSGIHTLTSFWSESLDYVLSEACTRFVNRSLIPLTYTLRFPFIIPSSGQPSKVITRLLVDFNCLVTFSINLKGTTIALTPNGGLISNTGTIITREFNIPSEASLTWEAGSTAYIEVAIDSQPSRGASLAYVGLTLEPTPFTLFT